MTTLLAALLVAQAQPVDIVDAVVLAPLFDQLPKTEFRWSRDRMRTPKISPKHEWQFDWLITGYAGSDDRLEAKIQVFSQQRRIENDRAHLVMRMTLRLLELNQKRMKLQQPIAYGDPPGMIDIYLCWGGEAGGEHLFDGERREGRLVRVNTIYIYDLNSFTQSIEMAREVAHEYGHATLPAIGGFETPEDWANGYLGEKLYLRWMRDLMAEGQMEPADSMGTTLEELGQWVRANVEPLEDKIALNGVNVDLMSRKGPAAMNEYLGLCLYIDSIAGPMVLGRAMRLTGSNSAKDFPAAVVDAFSEYDVLELNLPNRFKGKPVWLPVGKGKLSGGTVGKRSGAWAQVTSTTGKLKLAFPDATHSLQ